MKILKIAVIAGALCALLGIAAAAMMVFRPDMALQILGVSGSEQVRGLFEAKGGDLGTWKFSPDRCMSGEPQGFFGVLLLKKDDDDHLVKVIKDRESGEISLVVKVPGTDKGVRIRSCKQLHGTVQRSDLRFNKVWMMQGKLEVDCPDKHFRGWAEFSKCR